MEIPPPVLNAFRQGMVIPAMPLALTAERRLDERHQRALCRYYAAAGVGGMAIGVHTTQFAIHDPKLGLFPILLRLVSEEMDRADRNCTVPLMRIAGICGPTPQAVAEGALLRTSGYHAGLLSLGALRDATEQELLDHSRAVASVVPIIGFYLQPSVGGRALSYAFWRRFAEIPNVLGIKIAPFNRYQTLEVVRAVAQSGREEIALYTGNDDNIVLDLLTPDRVQVGAERVERRMVGGLLGHWSVWTSKAVELLKECRSVAEKGENILSAVLRRSIEVTDCNAAFFDSANHFAGCIAGLHEVLRRQGLLAGTWCLDAAEQLSSGQLEEINRVYREYPHLNDDAFVAAHLDSWLS